ncbi:tRNA (adenosine(37)-N6)-threonylcarbamoyltransferase complex ATPase subunit type 1 TsaE [Acetivibrio mesophilus]|uniref:tRNA threonylcarbamoyladenosine biosynthesis protein TsaE n=1 Tax=Acetivibrio mesophilus TaxID=2487273 RepID=A0A4Q0I2Z5_9FIRM|nr:tRNA (adenosine(37)-N6)-threonylcarbamoyltransferase complex ATPase subunit type 1 TsaE [Acetivibrio mesophilus]ODM26562.1 tRNA (N6-adenosine(37)-N6)-threonylcarbamoyltransferase complex ATPase TsaE [Clostridium sp. Bc-iso-3]RXE58551.1 tRNA (adenosine(37)-N6)-threonylcarbamoyltransferase complex ATPase subunit type 1 TsaE [Acetivibrio mesophilus]HHV28032.1 tRNA (adenosine(37)-N6)-threonylcarbamoyltransferase complex ATPase subunit type 1 TsaE [Clostridium sp.]
MKEIKTYSQEDTVEFGKKLGMLLKQGDIVCINGDLGTGKTVLTNGIAWALGINEYITSPTFTIVNEYERENISLYHFDVYRISDPEEMYEIGFEEYLYNGGVVVIEWADLIKDILPQDNIWITIEKDMKNGVDARIIRVEFNGERYREYEEKLGSGDDKKR